MLIRISRDDNIKSPARKGQGFFIKTKYLYLYKKLIINH
jgi:hypothetical protein